MLSIRKGDIVKVIAGRERSSTDGGKVLEVDLKGMRVLVEKKNLVKRKVKKSQQNPGGGEVEKEAYIHYSNVLLFCTKCNKGVRHGTQWRDSKGASGKGKGGAKTKVRLCKKCGGEL
jgi:large subunit ribosomal protein L24